MALLERVSTLIRANLNDLIDKAEDPEKMIKQVILDMQNQLMQVKTQVAIAIADQHVLEKKQKDNAEKEAEWIRKAELAVDKKQDDLARAALERYMSYKQMTESFDSLMADQKTEVDNLKSALHRLEQKLAEAQSKSEMLEAGQRAINSYTLREIGLVGSVDHSLQDPGYTRDPPRPAISIASALWQAATPEPQ